MTLPSLDELMLQLESTSHTWLQGQPVRPAELGQHLERILAVAKDDPDALKKVHGQIDRVLDRLHEAKARLVREQASVPGRRRAVRAHACLRHTPPTTFRVRA